MMLVWAARGFKLAFAKGQLGKKISWIGGALWIEPHGVRAFLNQSIMEDIQETLSQLLSLNVLAKTELRSLLGKLDHAAGHATFHGISMGRLWRSFSRTPTGLHMD